MGLDQVNSYDDLVGKISDPSLWPKTPEGDKARAALIRLVSDATAHVAQSDEAGKLKAVASILGPIQKVLSGGGIGALLGL
jgi:hypothetical protein